MNQGSMEDSRDHSTHPSRGQSSSSHQARGQGVFKEQASGLGPKLPTYEAPQDKQDFDIVKDGLEPLGKSVMMPNGLITKVKAKKLKQAFHFPEWIHDEYKLEPEEKAHKGRDFVP